MSSYVKLPKVFWGEALLTTNYLQNKSPTKDVTTNRTPYGLYFGRQPNLFYLRVFGYNKKYDVYCLMYIHDRKKIISKDVIFNKSFATHHEDQHLQKPVKEENRTSLQSNFSSKNPTIQGQSASPDQNASNG